MMQHIEKKRMKKKKNYLSKLWSSPWIIPVFLLVVLSIQGCGKEAGSEKKNDPVRFIKLYTVQDNTRSSPQLQFLGITKASEEADLAFRVAGPLVEFPVKEGQEVKKGDLLARLDPRDYNTAVQQVSASLQGSRAQLKAMQARARPEQMQQLKANVRVLNAQLKEVEMRYKRHQKLFEDEIISKQQLDGVKAEYDIALSQLEAAEEQLKEGQRGALRPVELGHWRDESIEVLSGLNVGDTIAVSAVQKLQTGMKVEQMKDLGEL